MKKFLRSWLGLDVLEEKIEQAEKKIEHLREVNLSLLEGMAEVRMENTILENKMSSLKEELEKQRESQTSENQEARSQYLDVLSVWMNGEEAHDD